MGFFDSLSHRFEGRGRTALYAVGVAVALVALVIVFSWWRESRADEARRALGKAIEIADAPVTTDKPQPGDTGPTFKSEQERAQRAVEEFQKIQKTYGSPYSDIARYFAAVNLLTIERDKGLSELEAVSRSGNEEVAARARFAIAQADEAAGKYDDAASIYQQLLGDKDKDKTVTENVLKLRLAAVYEKQGKRDEAANLLFQMVSDARKVQDKDGKPPQESTVIHAAADKLQELSPERYAQLPKEQPADNAPPF